MEKIRKNRVAVAIVLVLTVLAFFGLSTKNTEEEIDRIPEGSVLDYSAYANVVNGQDLLYSLGSVEAFDSLSRDLYIFGQAAYAEYKSNPDVIGFKINSDITTDDDTHYFEGRFGASSNNVAVEVKTLNNNKISTSISDTVTSLNIDELLDSNNKMNAFLGSLPISGEGYDIVYAPGDAVSIMIYLRNPDIYDKAYDKIVEAIGKEEAERLDLSVSYPSPSFEE